MKKLDEQQFTVSADVLFQEVAGEMVLLDLATEEYFGLDEIGARIWQAIDGGEPFETAMQQILDKFEVGREQLEQDVAALLDQLVQAGLLKSDAGPG